MIKDTPKTLCDSCRWMTRVRRKDRNDWRYGCGSSNTPMPSNGPVPLIDECSGYLRKGSMTLNEMYDTAWVLDTDPKRAIGFVAPGSARYKEITGRTALKYTDTKQDVATRLGDD